MKTGANLKDQKLIAYWYGQGGTAEQISKKMKIVLPCVKSFEPKNVNEVKKKTRVKNKRSQREHVAIMKVKTTPAIADDVPPPKSE